jgi:hypothetical protein
MDNREERHDVPIHLRRWPGLYVREGDRIVAASEEDAAVARSYPQWPDKGLILNGQRLSIMTERHRYQVNEEIRVIHVFEVLDSGYQIYVMGPKPVYGEYVDERLATDLPSDPDAALRPPRYDGVTLPSPAVDYNFDITTYKFADPGIHEIYWKLGALKSNTLLLEIGGVPPT